MFFVVINIINSGERYFLRAVFRGVYLRYPFVTKSRQYLSAYKGVYSNGTYAELERRIPKIERHITYLKENGRISTVNPGLMTPEDIREYAKFRREQGLKPSSIAHDVGTLGSICKYSGNDCVAVARIRYPTLFPRRTTTRLPIVERPEFEHIVRVAERLDEGTEYKVIRAFAISLFSFGTGSRTQEMQHAKLHNLSDDLTTIHFAHVKGSNTYGEPRTAPIRPEVRPFISRYLEVREPRESPFLFPNPEGNYLSTNILTRDRAIVMRMTNVDFDYRKCRRTYAQYLIDEGLPVEHASVLLGHKNTKTTEKSYARPRDDRIIASVVSQWRKLDDDRIVEES